MTATGILSAILIGILVGTLGRLILPGKQSIGAIATVAVGVAAALLGTYVSRLFGVEDAAPARWDWEWAGWHFTWSWAELGVQVGLAIIGVALAAALTNTVISDKGRPRKRRRKVRSES
jgi:uncharacterized membrane protein YeaQ/YmgE (transglycosylase-associated protein family)